VGVLDASNSLAYGSGLTNGVAGEVNVFWVESYDQYDNIYPFGAQNISVSLSGPGAAEVTVLDLANGTYEVRYVVNATGNHQITILANGVALGSPTSPVSDVAAGPAVPSLSYPLAPVVTLSQANEKQSFVVGLFDQFGNPRGVGGDAVAVTLSPAERTTATVLDNGDGTYTISWTALASGAYQLSVTVDELNIQDSPFAITVTPGLLPLFAFVALLF